MELSGDDWEPEIPDVRCSEHFEQGCVLKRTNEDFDYCYECLKHEQELDRKKFEAAKDAAKAPCLQFASAFHAALPRELRDEVYAYLIEDVVEDPYFMEVTFAMHWLAHDPSQAHKYREELDFIYFTQKEYVGADVASETVTLISPMLYDRDITVIINERDSINAWLTSDVFGVGVTPAPFVREIQVTWDEEKHDSSEAVDAAMEDMRALKLLAANCGVEVEITVVSDGETPGELAIILERFRPLRRALVERGIQVSFGNYTSCDGCFDLDAYFSLPQSKWIAKVERMKRAMAKRKRKRNVEENYLD